MKKTTPGTWQAPISHGHGGAFANAISWQTNRLKQKVTFGNTKESAFFLPIGSLKLTANATENRSNLIKGKEKVFQASIFRCYVSFSQGICLHQSFFVLGGGEIGINLKNVCKRDKVKRVFGKFLSEVRPFFLSQFWSREKLDVPLHPNKPNTVGVVMDCALPETNSKFAHEKKRWLYGWKMKFPVGALKGLFSSAFAVSFREGNFTGIVKNQRGHSICIGRLVFRMPKTSRIEFLLQRVRLCQSKTKSFANF